MDSQGESEIVQPTTPEAPQRESLDDKFPLHTLTLDKGNIKYRDIEPDNPRAPENRPLLMLTGWAMNQEVVGNTVKGLYEKGAHPVPVDFEGGKLGIGGEAEMLATLLRGMKDEKVDILGQSMAAITVLSMIEKHPELRDKIGKVLLVSPMGLGGKDSLLGLGKRQLDEIKRDGKVEKNEERQAINKRVGESFGRFLKGSLPRAVKEIWGMKGADKYAVLDVLKESGIKTAIIQGDLDQLNSSERVWDNISRQSVAGENARDIRGKDGKEMPTPEYLRINDSDDEQTKARKLQEFVAFKERINRENNDPPFDSITMTAGGHEIHGPRIMADKIIQTLDSLDNEFEGGANLEARMMEKDRIVKEKLSLEQGKKDEQDLQTIRQELDAL